MSAGARYMVGSAFFFSLMGFLVKLSGARLPASEIVFARSVVTLVISYALVRRARVHMWGSRRALLVTRGFFGFGALFCFFYALTKLPLADVTVLHFTNPVFTSLLASVFLGEMLRGREIAGLGVSLAGVVLVAQPSLLFGEEARNLNMTAVTVALVGSFLSAGAYTCVRKLRETEHPHVIVFYFSLVATPASIPFMVPQAIWPTPLEWLLLASVGLATQMGQILLTRGLYLERAGRAMTMSYVQIVFAALWGIVFFGETPNHLAVAGAVLVVSGALMVSAPVSMPEAVVGRRA